MIGNSNNSKIKSILHFKCIGVADVMVAVSLGGWLGWFLELDSHWLLCIVQLILMTGFGQKGKFDIILFTSFVDILATSQLILKDIL